MYGIKEQLVFSFYCIFSTLKLWCLVRAGSSKLSQISVANRRTTAQFHPFLRTKMRTTYSRLGAWLSLYINKPTNPPPPMTFHKLAALLQCAAELAGKG